jgi:hypothetical protein
MNKLDLQYQYSNASFLEISNDVIKSPRPWWASEDKKGQKNSDQLKRLHLSFTPAVNRWVRLTDEVEFEQEFEEDKPDRRVNNDGEKETRTKHIFRFRTPIKQGKDSLIRPTPIEKFLKAACEEYVNSISELDDNNRYLYVLNGKHSSGGDSNRRGPCRGGDDDTSQKVDAYKRYLLSDTKTLATLFLVPEKKQVLVSTIDHFVNGTGIYAVPGYPRKLGIMLHGPPGIV